jgi:hypothetical protein
VVADRARLGQELDELLDALIECILRAHDLANPINYPFVPTPVQPLCNVLLPLDSELGSVVGDVLGRLAERKRCVGLQVSDVREP